MDNFKRNVIIRYKTTQSIKECARFFKVSEGKIKKILISAGEYSNETSISILSLREQGYSGEEIKKMLGISNSALSCNAPYEKCVYNSDNPTKNALAIRKCRDAKKDPHPRTDESLTR